jgi:DNA-binding MarR family transcriptional regulator
MTNRKEDHQMVRIDTYTDPAPSLVRSAIVRWAAGLGAVTAEALATHLHVSPGSARARLAAAERRGLLVSQRPLTDRPALYAVTRAGLRAVAARGLEPCRVSPACALHLIECAWAAATLERCYPEHRVSGERELRRDEREQRRSLASAELDGGTGGELQRHRPDLVLWPAARSGERRPVAVEIELTVKAPERLLAICRGWARSRCVAGVLYLATPTVERALLRAVDRAQAGERITIVPLEALPDLRQPPPRERTVPSAP